MSERSKCEEKDFLDHYILLELMSLTQELCSNSSFLILVLLHFTFLFEFVCICLDFCEVLRNFTIPK